MNTRQKIFTSFNKSDRFSMLASATLVVLMMVCAAFTFLQIGTRLTPSWQGWYLPLATGIIAIESFISRYITREFEINARIAFHTAKWVIIGISLKAVLYLLQGAEKLWEDVPRWQSNLLTFFEGEFLPVLALLVIFWLISSSFAEDIDNLAVNETDIEWEQGKLENLRKDIRQSMLSKILFTGSLIVLISFLTRLDLKQIWGETPASQLSIINILIYFLLAFILLSISQFALLKGRWYWGRVEIDANIGKNWLKYGLIFITLITILAFILPARFTIGLLESLGYLINFLIQVINFLIGMITYPILLLLSLLGSQSTSQAQETRPVIPEVLPPTPPAMPVPWLELIKSILFWIAFIAIIFWAFRYYFHQNARLREFFKRNRFLNTVTQWLNSLISWFIGATVKAAGKTALAIKNLMSRTRQSKNILQRLDFAGLDSRKKALTFYYFFLKRAESAGYRRQQAQTPGNFSKVASNQIPDVAEDIGGLTQVFTEAKYSQHPINQQNVDQAQGFWRRIARKIKSLTGKPA